MHQLVETVLTVGSRLPKVNGAGGHRHRSAVHLHALAVAFHVQLLDVWHETKQGLAVGQDGHTFVAQQAAIPHVQQSQDQGQIIFGRRLLEMFIHGMPSFKKGVHHTKAILQRQRQNSHGTPNGETTSHPVPEAKDVVGVDAKGLGLIQCCRAGHHVLRHTVFARRLHQPCLDGLGIEHRLCSGEGLGDDHHQGRLWVQAFKGPLHVDGVYIGQEPQLATAGCCGSLRVGL
mmetsp:Transcript_86617/g.176783  ORF Transcript_86617/g.176783 Transcript_86617/m.176783 type:complete len:231 (-) Transcript_86617:526-1218(-)